MRHLKNNMLVQFSVASFVIMFALAAGITSLLSIQLGHQIDDMVAHNALMEDHNALMMADSDMVGMMAMFAVEVWTGTYDDPADAYTIQELTDAIATREAKFAERVIELGESK